MDSDRLSDATIVITGASAGIGAATARRVASAGANVVLAARRENRLDELAAEIEADHGVTALVQPTDVRDSDAVGALIAATAEQFGGVDGIVANAGLARGSDVTEMSDEQYRTMMGVNVDGAFFTAREALPHLVDSDGDLVFVGSFAGQYPRPYNPVYAASKWWVRGFARSLAAQESDVGVTVVNPAEVRTEFGAEDEAPAKERLEPDEASSPEEVADAIAFALKQDGSTVAELDLYRDGKFGDEFA
jgi:NADP-dependent 3-hydroxy acid dehydrogenase YdfG